jgi:dolichol-phosphate mannosyltransferase
MGALPGSVPRPAVVRRAPDLVSVVVPCYNEGENLPALYERLEAALRGFDWEAILVDDGSADGTFDTMRDLARRDGRVRAIRFSRNFGHQYALLAGIRESRGRVVVTMDADLQHPPETVPILVEEWRRGFNIVHTRRRGSGETGWFKRGASRAYYRFFSLLSGVRIEPGTSDFRLMDRRVADALRSMQEAELFLRGLVMWMGYRHTFVEYEVGARHAGRSKYTVGKMLRFAGSGITSFSTIPLRVGIVIGFVTSALACVEIGYVIWAKVRGTAVPGWASMTALLCFLFGLSFVLVGLLGVYVGHIFRRVQNHPTYFVEERTDEAEGGEA